MKKLLLALALLFAPTAAFAQCNGIAANGTVCGNNTGAPNTFRAVNPASLLGAAGGTNGQIQYNNAGALAGFTMSGDVAVNTATGAATIQPNAVTNSKIAAGTAGTAKGTVSGSITDALVSTLLNAACSVTPSTCQSVLGYSNILWYGAKCDTKIISSSNTYSITSGTNVLTTSGSFTFSSADVGKSIWVPGAGVASAGLSTTISGFTNSTTVTLAANASTTITNLAASQANPVIYGTNDTAAINATIAGVPDFATVYINPVTSAFPVLGCLIKQTGATNYALLVNHPVNLLGAGNGSALITDPSMGTTIRGIYAPQSGVTWKGVTWSGFLLGTSTNFVPFTRYGQAGIYFDATSAGPGGFQGLNLGPNLSIGESANGYYSIWIDGIATQGNRIWNNYIAGGIYLNATADSNMILENRLYGIGNYGITIDTPGAGNFVFLGNSVQLAAGLCLMSGSGIVVSDNFFEEETASVTYPHNAFVDVGCSTGTTLNSTWITNNIILTGQNTTSYGIKIDANSVSTVFYANEIANANARTSVTNANATTVCGPNQWITSATHVSGTAPINWGPAC